MHIVQRGNDRQKCFRRHRDYAAYLRALRTAARQYEVEIHAYALMAHYVHLLVTPRRQLSASRMMQRLGREYVQRYKKFYGRTGTIWEARFRYSNLDTAEYLLACYRYVELNPVRAGIVSTPEKYRWSSYHVNALGCPSEVLTPRQEWRDLGGSREKRCRRYRRLFDDGPSFEDLTATRHQGKGQSPLGSDP